MDSLSKPRQSDLEWAFSMFSGISITCFAASYGVSLLLEISRLFFRVPVRIAIILGFGFAGLTAHTLYLMAVARGELSAGSRVAMFSNWHDWCLLAAWVLTVTYLGLVVKRPENAVGIFLLPLILILIGLALIYQDGPSFVREDAMWLWSVVHGAALLMGTVSVLLGFAAGLMYLFQSSRLKHKVPPHQGLKLPSLEWLLRVNRRALLLSTCLLALGLASGIVLNLLRNGVRMHWTDPIILSSGVLFAWLLMVTVFEYWYKPARQGRKVAYLTLASFVFLALAMWFVLQGRHAGQPASNQTRRPPSPQRGGTELPAESAGRGGVG